MQIKKTKFKGLKVIINKIYKDSRGYFKEDFKSIFFKDSKFVFSCTSKSKKNVLRGLHLQTKNMQGKFVSVLKGSILDVAVDIRKNSKTFGKHQTFILSDKNCRQLWIPKNFAHGFLTLSSNTIVSYKCTDFYNPSDQNTIIWNDEILNIAWPIKKPIISENDKKGILFKNIK